MSGTYRTVAQIRSNCLVEYQIFSNPKPAKFKSCGKKEIFSQSSRKRMKKIVELLNYTYQNAETDFSFITLTLSSPQKKNTDYYKLLKKLLEKLQYHYRGCKYIWKAEHQKNNNVHYHILATKKIDWQFVRSIWNRIQCTHVDEYQKKMKAKYKNGYHYDKEMKDSTGNIYSEEKQEKIYKKNYKANFRNPNSTDVKIIDNKQSKLQSYLYKYITKEENKEVDKIYQLKRYWGCSDELKLMKYATIEEADTHPETYKKLTSEIIKTIEENGIIKCKIYNLTLPPEIKKIEEERILENKKLVEKNQNNNTDSAKRIVNKYQYLFDL